MMKGLIKKIFRRLHPVAINGEGNHVTSHSKYGRNFLINISGNNNTVEIAEDCLLTNTLISISGNNNRVIIDKTARFMGPCKISMSGNSTLHIGENAGIRGVEFVLDNADISVGKLCMFSYNVIMRNTDSHKVIRLADGLIVNAPKSISLGDHVWIGYGSIILKGVQIGENSIIAAGSVVTKDCPSNAVTAGCPSRIVKTGITWDY